MKPKVLYHASSNKKISVLEPRAETVRDKNEGPVVFATPSKAEASKFIVPSDDSWTRKMNFGDVLIHIINGRKRYQEADMGGSIYHLRSKTFDVDEKKGMGRKEWTSKVPVRPYKRDNYKSGLEAQLTNGVQVYFVNKSTFNSIINSKDHGNSIIRSLKSENEKQNVNYREIPSIKSNLRT